MPLSKLLEDVGGRGGGPGHHIWRVEAKWPPSAQRKKPHFCWGHRWYGRPWVGPGLATVHTCARGMGGKDMTRLATEHRHLRSMMALPSLPEELELRRLEAKPSQPNLSRGRGSINQCRWTEGWEVGQEVMGVFKSTPSAPGPKTRSSSFRQKSGGSKSEDSIGWHRAAHTRAVWPQRHLAFAGGRLGMSAATPGRWRTMKCEGAWDSALSRPLGRPRAMGDVALKPRARISLCRTYECWKSVSKPGAKLYPLRGRINRPVRSGGFGP